MKLHLGSFWIAIVMALGLISCVSAEDRLKAKFDTLPQVDATLLYEYRDVSSGATGECIGTFLDRWYGTTLDAETVEKIYSNSFVKTGWSIRPEEVVEIWSTEGEDGLYRASLDIFADPAVISQEQGGYKLPDSILHDAVSYQTVYLLGMVYMFPNVAQKCFEQ
jgi:hypothetical protein